MVNININTTILGDDNCPHCGKVLDAVTHANNEKVSPSVGDVTICIGCANILEFAKDLKLQKLTPETWQSFGEYGQNQLRKEQQKIIGLIKNIFKE